MIRNLWKLILTLSALGLTVQVTKADEQRDYGEYLSGECTTCHRLDGTDNGIPAIVGWPIESFVVILKAYKTGERENLAMISVAESLDDEQINALAAYYSSLEAKE